MKDATGASYPVHEEARNTGTEYGKIQHDGKLDRLFPTSNHLKHISNPKQEHVDAYAAAHGYKPLVFATPVHYFATSTWTETEDRIEESVSWVDLEKAQARASKICEFFYSEGVLCVPYNVPVTGITGSVPWHAKLTWASDIREGISVETASGENVVLTQAQADELRARVWAHIEDQRGHYDAAIATIEECETTAEVEDMVKQYCSGTTSGVDLKWLGKKCF